MLPTPLLVTNGILLVSVIIIAIRTARLAQLYNYWVGDESRRMKYRSQVLRGLVGITFIGLIAAIFNIIFV